MRALHAQCRAALLVGLAGSLLLAIWAGLALVPAIAAGWLVGFLFWLCVAVGALLLLAIHAVTAGRWGHGALPALRPAAATIPLFLLLILPILLSVFLASLPPTHRLPHDVAAAAPPGSGWSVRGFGALLVWSVLGFLLLRGHGPRRLIAAIGLCLHGMIITLVGIDWILSVAATSIRRHLARQSPLCISLAALGWIAIAAVVPSGGAGKAGDIGGLLIAAALGSLYLGFSQYLVVWYWEYARTVSWYLDRQHGLWLWIDLLGDPGCPVWPRCSY